MSTKDSTQTPKRGRPKSAPNLSRSNRIVTFVTDQELEFLQSVSREEERSMAAVVHRIIKSHFGNQ